MKCVKSVAPRFFNLVNFPVKPIVFGSVFMFSGGQSVFAQDANTDEVEEVMVVGHRASAASAQTLKRDSAQVLDSVVAEDMGKLPDNNVADALARVTGVQIRRDSGEGNSVLVRGLPNVVTLLNGREVFTTTGRFIELADIPASMLERVDVYKTNGASLVEGGIAGTIDVKTRRPLGGDGFQLFVNGSGVYSDKSESSDPELSLTASNNWDTNFGEIGALVGVSYLRRNYHEERVFNIEPDLQVGAFSPSNPAPVPDFQGPFVVGQIPIAGERERTATNFVVEWKPSDNSKVFFDGFISNFKDVFELDFFVGLPFLGNGDISATVIPGTNQQQTLTNHDVFTITSTQANDQDSRTSQFVLGGSYDVGNFSLSTEVVSTTSEFDYKNPILDVATVVPDVFVNTNNSGSVLLRYGGAGYDIRDGSNYDIVNWFDNYGNDEGDSFVWSGDVNWIPSSDSVVTAVNFGLRYASRKAESIRSFDGAAYPFAASPTSSLPGLDDVSEPLASGGPQYDLVQWYTPSARYLLENTDLVRQQTACQYDTAVTSPQLFALRNDPTTCKRLLDPGTFFSDEEDITSAYVETDLEGMIGGKDWSAQIGVRVSHTEQKLTGNLSQEPIGGGGGVLTYVPVTSKNTSTDFLPSASFKLFLTDELIGRMALGRTLTRPDFPDLNPGVALSTVVSNTTGLTGSGGNPELEAVESDNFDVALEWYFANAGSVTGTVFYREFEGYVQPTFEDQTFGGLSYRVSRPGNTGSGSLSGFELSYQQFYDNLPGVLSGFGLQANVTYMDGETEDLATGRDLTITGVSDWSANLIVLYENSSWSGRLAYNWRADFIDAYAFASNQTGVYDLYVDETAQLDASLAYHLNDQITLTFDAVNLLDTEFKDYFNNPDIYPRDTRRYDRTYSLGFRASF